MKQKKSALCFLLAAVMLISAALASCSPKAGGTESTAAQSTETEPLLTEPEETTPAESQAETPEESAGQTEIEYVPEPDSPFAGLPVFADQGCLAWKEMGDGAEMLVYSVQDAGKDEAYGKELENSGFTLYAENEIGDNRFATWISEDTEVTLMYLPFEQTVRIVAEPIGPLWPSEAEEFDTVCEPEMAMVGTNYDRLKGNGMCFLYRLSDGRLMVVDGGFNREDCADALYNAMTKLAPDPENIVIAAWFITHAHADHIGAFYSFSSAYTEKVKVERFVINFPTEEVFTMCDNSLTHLTRFSQMVSRYPGAEVIEAHPGQVYYFGDAVVEMLSTWELYPWEEDLTFFNNTSLVFSVELGGERLMQLGDCGPEESKVLEAMYGEYLKSDIIQVAHHGYKGASGALNTLIDPDVVLYPTSRLHYMQCNELKDNRMLYEVELKYVADESAWYFPLPFDADGVVSELIPFTGD